MQNAFFNSLLVAALFWLRHAREERGPMYRGRHIADWVAEALEKDGSRAASEVVVEIGAPAVPFIAKQGLHDPSHSHAGRGISNLRFEI